MTSLVLYFMFWTNFDLKSMICISIQGQEKSGRWPLSFLAPKRKEFCRPNWPAKAFLRSTLSTMIVQTIDRLIWWLWDYCCSMPPKDPRAWPSVGGSSIPSYDLLITKIQNRPITKIRPALVSNQNTWYCHIRLLTFSQTFLSKENYNTIQILMKITILY